MFEEPCHVASLPHGSFATYVDVTSDCFRSLVVSFVHSRPDYGNLVLVGLPAYLQRRLRAVLNAAARLVFRLRRPPRDRCPPRDITLAVRLPERVNFKLSLMAYRVQHGMAPPAYLNQLFPVSPSRSSPSSVVIYTRAVRSVILSDNYWPSLVSCCSHNCLEYFACPCPVITFYCNLSSAAEDTLVPTVISGQTMIGSNDVYDDDDDDIFLILIQNGEIFSVGQRFLRRIQQCHHNLCQTNSCCHSNENFHIYHKISPTPYGVLPFRPIPFRPMG